MFVTDISLEGLFRRSFSFSLRRSVYVYMECDRGEGGDRREEILLGFVTDSLFVCLFRRSL